MTHRETVKAILHYENFDRMPVVHFGWWPETIAKWHEEGHLTKDEFYEGYADGRPRDYCIGKKLGFDFNWYSTFQPATNLFPFFEPRIVEELPDGSQKMFNAEGVIVLKKPGTNSIAMEFAHLLKDRASWEEHYLPRLQFSPERIQTRSMRVNDEMVQFDQGGLDFLKADTREYHYGIFCGSLIGVIRNWLGVEGLSYLYADDEELYEEIINTVGNLSYETTKATLETGAKFDFAHFWEDVCYKNGPLVAPSVFRDMVAPHYRRITGLLNQYGIDIVSVDCDGWIDSLLPHWLENGVNTMFPIEVGTWQASMAPWREKYGRTLRGVGGMNKNVFSRDRKAVDAEVERLKPLVALGGYIPCPDHRIAPDAKWDMVSYYCDRMRHEFS
jgi:uroporphyrinogen decarboxylase